MKTLRYFLCASVTWILGAYAFINVFLIMFITNPDQDWPPTNTLFLMLKWLIHVALPGGLAVLAWNIRRSKVE
jgi:hypothetical protein